MSSVIKNKPMNEEGNEEMRRSVKKLKIGNQKNEWL